MPEPTSFQSQYNRCLLVESCLPDMSISDKFTGFWNLDGEIRKAIDPIIEQYNQGLLHSIELINALNDEMNKARK